MQQRDVEVDVVVGLHDELRVVAFPVQAEDVLQSEDGLQGVVVGVFDVVHLDEDLIQGSIYHCNGGLQ